MTRTARLVPVALLAAAGTAALLTVGAGHAAAAARHTSASRAAVTAAAAATTPVGVTVHDQAGATVTVVDVVRDFPGPAFLKHDPAQEIVLVEVKDSASRAFAGGLPASAFTVTEPGATPGSPRVAVPADSLFEPAMAAAGYQPLADVAAGGNADGWLAFPVDHRGEKGLQLRYLPATGALLSTLTGQAPQWLTAALPDLAG